jgi:hypothetical protein
MPFKPIQTLRCLLRYDHLLSPYVDCELEARTRQRLEDHLQDCLRCRAALSDIQFASSMAAKISLTDEAINLVPLQSEPAVREIRRPRRPGFILTPLTALLLAAALLTSFWVYNRLQNSTWQVVRLDGAPKINSILIQDTKDFAVGEWLETDQASRARVSIGKIGHVDVEPNTRLRLVSTKLTEQRIQLERGKLQATISAPPRIFFVDTPSAQAVDLGCAYTLEADEQGNGVLRVTAGWVAFVLNGYEAKVPAGAGCNTRPGKGPGTPCFLDAAPEFQSNLEKYDFGIGSKEVLASLLDGARARDTLTLFHLLFRVKEDERKEVYDKLAAFAPPPAEVNREGILQLDEKMLSTYREKLEPTWLQESAPQFRKFWRWIWS